MNIKFKDSTHILYSTFPAYPYDNLPYMLHIREDFSTRAIAKKLCITHGTVLWVHRDLSEDNIDDFRTEYLTRLLPALSGSHATDRSTGIPRAGENGGTAPERFHVFYNCLVYSE